MLKYAILVLEQDGWMFTIEKTIKKILIRKVARIVAPTFFFLSLSKHRLRVIS